jgi:glycine cleavage system transcriptional repressor
MSKTFVISVMAKDRVGIVADVTTAIRNLGGNLADMSQTVLRGHFTMILIGSFPDEVTAAAVRAALKTVEGETTFEVGVHEAAEEPPAEEAAIAENQYVLTAVGPDRTGLVSAVTEYLRQKEINIRDLSTCVEDGVYTMILLLDLPVGTNVARLKHSLQVAMEDVALSVELRHHALFRHTNEI